MSYTPEQNGSPHIPADGDPARIVFLRTVFSNLADGALDDATKAFMNTGGGLRDCLRELTVLEPDTPHQQQLTQTRQDYMGVALTKPSLRNRLARKTQLQETEDAYVDSMVGYLEAILDASTAEECLAVRQLPSIVRRTTFDSSQPMANLAGNHLYLLQDLALREHIERRSIIDQYRSHGFKQKYVDNRVFRVALASAVFAASFAPELSFIPHPDEIITSDIEIALKGLSAVVLGIDLPEVIRLKQLDRSHAKETRKLNVQLAGNEETADLAMRIVYGSSRYGSSRPGLTATDRSGTADTQENLRRFKLTTHEIDAMRDDPGSRPYTGPQALGYAARFLVEREHQLAPLTDDTVAPEDKRHHYLTLVRDVFYEDLARMKQGLSVTRFRKEIMKLIGVAPALVFPSLFSGASESLTLSKDLLHVLGQPEQYRSPD